MNKAAFRVLSTAACLILAGILLFSCSGKEKSAAAAVGQSGTSLEHSPDQTTEQAGIKTVAERIVYDVEIINPYPDDLWTTECLEPLDHEALVDFVFNGIYEGKFSAFDIFEETPLPARKIRKMEENGEFSRGSIGKFQFQEEWILDTETMTFSKKVTEIRMGLQKFNEDGDLTGYAPLLRVVL